MHKVVISLSKERNPRVGPKHNSDAFINLADGGLAVAGLVPLLIMQYHVYAPTNSAKDAYQKAQTKLPRRAHVCRSQ